jgi:hypothetical protein
MSRYRSEIIVSLFLIMTTLAVYWQVGNHEFVNYDDDAYVTENRQVRAGCTIEGVTWAFLWSKPRPASSYQPVSSHSKYPVAVFGF